MFRDCRAALSHARGQPRRHRSPCSGRSAVPDRFIKLLSSGSRRNQRKAAWGEEQTGHANPRARTQQCQRLFVLCNSAIARALRSVHKDYDAVAGLALP